LLEKRISVKIPSTHQKLQYKVQYLRICIWKNMQPAVAKTNNS